MRLRSAVVLLSLVVWTVGAMATVAYQTPPHGTIPENEIDIDDPRIGEEFAREFTGECESEVCAEESPVVYMPFGCEGKSDNPHKSETKKYRGEIAAKSYTLCPIKIRRVSVTNQLWRHHFIIWGKEGKVGNETRTDARSVRAVAATACNNDLYLVTATHTLVGYNRKTYFSASGKSASVNC